MNRIFTLTSLIIILVLHLFAQSEKYPLQIGDDSQTNPSWSPHNDLILTSTGDDNALRLWDVNTGKVIWKRDVGFLLDDTEIYSIYKQVWSDDQKFVLTGTANGKIQLWEVEKGKLIWNIKAHNDSIDAIAISPDRTIFISAANAEKGELKSSLKLWNFNDGKLIKDFGANHKAINAVKFIDNKNFKTGNGYGQILSWSIEQNLPIQTKQLKPCGFVDKKYSKIVYSPQFNFIASQCQKKIVITDTRTGKAYKNIPKAEHYKFPSFSDNEKILFLPDTIDSKILDLQTGRITEFDDFEDGELNNEGTLIAAVSYSYPGFKIYSLKTGNLQKWFVGHPGVINSLTFSSDGKRFASVSGDEVVRIWDTETKKILLTLEGHSAQAGSVEFSKDGKLLTSRSEKEIIVWNAATGAIISKTKKENRFENEKSFSSSGKFELIKEYNKKPFRIADAKTGATIKEFIYIDQLDNLLFTPDENHLLVKPWWKGWQLWSVQSGKMIREFDIGYSHSNKVAFHPDGKTFLTGGSGQNIFMFNLETGEKIWSLFPIDYEEFEQKNRWEAIRIGEIKAREDYAAQADTDNRERVKKITAEFSHYGNAESFWHQRIGESGVPNKSKLQLPKEKATAAWFILTNNADLPISIETNSFYFNRKCKGLCDGAEISLRYIMELKNGEAQVNGYDMLSHTILPPKTRVLFNVDLKHIDESEAIYLGFTFQKDNPNDKDSNDYGNEQKLYLRQPQ